MGRKSGYGVSIMVGFVCDFQERRVGVLSLIISVVRGAFGMGVGVA